MKSFFTFKALLVITLWIVLPNRSLAQACTTLGQTPSTAFPVCGTTTFHQTNVPLCSTNDLFVPGCSGGPNSPNYQNKNPFFYKFTCFTAGTLGFRIVPLLDFEDYDWQLYDITGRNPDEIFTNNSLVVIGNWSGTYGPTGAAAGGVNFTQCASDPASNAPTFSMMPTLTVGHVYLLMISHYTDGQSGYDLTFGGGTASITDPLMPHMQKVTPDCDGTKLTLKLNKKVLCNSITLSGSEFSVPGNTVLSATPDSCSFAFDFDEVVITLATPLTSGTHQLVIGDGTDNSTLIDNCEHRIPVNETISFDYIIPQPIRADSVGKPACAVDSVLVYYPKKIRCTTLSPNGSDFSVTGPTPVTVISATGNCVNDLTEYVIVKFASPIYRRGTYTLHIQPGIDGSPVFDLCGQPILGQDLTFTTADTVSALFTYTEQLGCQRDTLNFSHDGAHDVNSWSWVFNNGTPITTQTHTMIWPATSTNTVQLIVSNGTCRDTASSTIVLDNEVKAGFIMPDIICPEDGLEVTDTSKGLINSWTWTFDRVATSNIKNPAPVMFPMINHEAYYTIKLKVTNNALNCSDSARKSLTVLDHCFIAVPTAFTPNNDGLNDTFQPHNAIKADNLVFMVYNRWGQLVFQSKHWRDRWDGKIDGVVQGTGVYVWMLSYTHRDTKKQVFQKGTVLLIK
jgi:gliding motility-associated-like protein